jgi:hypothetical protein
MHLNVDTRWYVRYRSTTNPDFGATFPQAVTITNGTAIPVSNTVLNGTATHLHVIANTAAFHFGFIEQGGSSLYQAMSQKVSSLEVLKITLGIGRDEIAHFLEWVDFSGNGVQAPVAPVKSSGTIRLPLSHRLARLLGSSEKGLADVRCCLSSIEDPVLNSPTRKIRSRAFRD